MITKIKTALIAALIFGSFGSASAALVQASGEELQNSEYLRNSNASVPMFQQYAYIAPSFGMIEGRNVYEGPAGAYARVPPQDSIQFAQANPYSRGYGTPANRHPIESFGG